MKRRSIFGVLLCCLIVGSMYGAKPKQLSVKALDNDTDQSHVNDVENTGFCDETILVMLKKDIDSFPKTLLVEWHFFGLH